MPKTEKKREILVLLDTHAIIHRAYHALPELTSPKGEPVGAMYGLAAILMKLAKELSPDHIIAAYDLPGPTHRHEVYKEYKAKRPAIDDALVAQIGRSRDVLAAFGVPIYEAPGFEADDVIGTIAERAKDDFDVIIASGDMDTLQLIDGGRVRVFTLKKGINDTILYDEAAVVERFGFGPTLLPDFKGLRGDPSDNIIGVPGIGEKTATALVTAFGSLDRIYAALKKNSETFKAKTKVTDRIIALLKEHEEEAEFSKVLATIRTDAPIRFAMPRGTFKDSLDTRRVTELFTELGFRSLVPRLAQLSGAPPASIPLSEPALHEQAPENGPLQTEAAIMLWLTNSELTNPALDDILNETGARSVSEAHEKLSVLVAKEKLSRVWEDIERPLIPVIEELNATGILIDRHYLEKLSREYHAELDRVAKKIYTLAGTEFNVNSPKQLGEVLFVKLGITGGKGTRQKKTATGQISTRESELAKLKDVHPVIAHILEHRELAKLLGTYIDAIPPLLGADGRLRTTFVQSGTTTGRLSSKDPNLQNIPIKSESGRRIRTGFIAGKGRRLLALDYSQIELRLAALLSGDEGLTGIFKRGEDVHAAVAAEVFGVSQDKVDYEMRRKAKVINFGILYGMGVNALRESLGTDRAEAQAFYNRYFETYERLARYLEETKASAARLGYTTSYFGRRRYFPGLKSKLPYVRAQAERMAINAPLQGAQSDIMKLAMTRIHSMIKEGYEGKAALVLQIHDELIFEVDDGALAPFAQEVRRLMENALPKEEMRGIPLTVSSAAGQDWGDMSTL